MKYFNKFRGREDKFVGMISNFKGEDPTPEFREWLQKELSKFAGESVIVTISQVSKQEIVPIQESFEQTKELVFG